MRHEDPIVPQMREVRDELRRAGERAAAAAPEAAPRRARRPPRRLIAAVAALLTAGAAAATASQLISVGKPVDPGAGYVPDRYRPGAARLVLAATAPDNELKQQWGVEIFDKPGGVRCASAGVLRGRTLGEIRDGRFSPYRPNSGAACSPRAAHGPLLVVDVRAFAGPSARRIYYGRAGAGVRRVRLDTGETHAIARTGTGGAFLFVTRPDRVDIGRVDIQPVR